jgi:hypothetical protein
MSSHAILLLNNPVDQLCSKIHANLQPRCTTDTVAAWNSFQLEAWDFRPDVGMKR